VPARALGLAAVLLAGPVVLSSCANVTVLTVSHAGDTDGVAALCLDPHDLAIAKYCAGREKDILFTRQLAARAIVSRDRLLALLDQTAISEEMRVRIRAYIASDFDTRNRDPI